MIAVAAYHPRGCSQFCCIFDRDAQCSGDPVIIMRVSVPALNSGWP